MANVEIVARRSESLRVWLWRSAIAARRLCSSLADAACLQHVLGGGLGAGLHFSRLGHDHMQLHDPLGGILYCTYDTEPPKQCWYLGPFIRRPACSELLGCIFLKRAMLPEQRVCPAMLPTQLVSPSSL